MLYLHLKACPYLGRLRNVLCSLVSYLEGNKPLVRIKKHNEEYTIGIYFEVPLALYNFLGNSLLFDSKGSKSYHPPQERFICTESKGGMSGSEPIFRIEKFDKEGHLVFEEVYTEHKIRKEDNKSLGMLLSERTEVVCSRNGFVEYKEKYLQGRLHSIIKSH